MTKMIYSIFLGILIATFIGVGVAAFYKSPTSPQYPMYPQSVPQKDGTVSADTKLQEKFQKQQDVFLSDMKTYNRNVSLFVLLAAIIVLTASLVFAKRLEVLGDGLLLGSALSLIYSIFRGFAANDDMYRFVIVGISLGMVLFIGYKKFLIPQKSS